MLPPPVTTPAAFHCQQAVEKGLKAFLVSRGQRFRKVHNLTYLLDLCEDHDEDLAELRDDVQRLNPFAVNERYPGGRADPPADVVRELLNIAEQVLATVQETIER